MRFNETKKRDGVCERKKVREREKGISLHHGGVIYRELPSVYVCVRVIESERGGGEEYLPPL